jgi:hypothetical protein
MLVTRRNRGEPDAPSPKEIRRACEQIQATWTPRERNKRAGQPRGNFWTPPEVRMSAVSEAVNDDWCDRFPYACNLRRQSDW